MKFLINFFKFVWDDIKTDFKFIFHVLKSIKDQKPILREEYKQQLKDEWKSYGGIGNYFLEVFKTYWLMFFLMALFFVAGMWYAEQRCQDRCNTFILNTFYDNGEWIGNKYRINQNIVNIENNTNETGLDITWTIPNQ